MWQRVVNRVENETHAAVQTTFRISDGAFHQGLDVKWLADLWLSERIFHSYVIRAHELIAGDVTVRRVAQLGRVRGVAGEPAMQRTVAQVIVCAGFSLGNGALELVGDA